MPKTGIRAVPSEELLFPSAEALGQIASSASGDLRTVPFANLLLALNHDKRTCVVEARRRHLRKSILIENGVPAECRSNVLHDTFAFYLREMGQLSSAEYSSSTKEALARGVPIGEVLLSQGLLTSGEILALLQKLLAKVLLDVFAWTDGSFLIVNQVPKVKAPLKLRLGQLVLTGVSRFTPQANVDRATSLLGDRQISAYPKGRSRTGDRHVDTLRLSASDRDVIDALRREPLSFRELATLLPHGEAAVQRSLYALSLLGIVDLDSRVRKDSGRATDVVPPATSTIRLTAPQLSGAELSDLYLDHRRISPAQLLGVDEPIRPEALNDAYLKRTQALTALSLSEDPTESSQAGDLLVAVARAYSELSTRPQLVEGSPTPEAAPPREDEKPVIPELLDPAKHYSEGLEQMESGDYGTALSNLELASDCAPQRGLYRAQAAYCLFLKSSGNASQALDILTDTHRLDPTCGLAFLYAGEILVALDRFEEAEETLRTASKLMAPDRRPIEKLRELRQLERALG